MSVCKMFFFLNLMKKIWNAPGKVLASSEKNAFCHCNWTLLCLKENTKLFDWFSVVAMLILVHSLP